MMMPSNRRVLKSVSRNIDQEACQVAGAHVNQHLNR
jgi:hypothetical protein